MTTINPAAVLRLAQAVPESAENYRILRELKDALKDLVTISNETKESPDEHA
jgi:hypothetical protein